MAHHGVPNLHCAWSEWHERTRSRRFSLSRCLLDPSGSREHEGPDLLASIRSEGAVDYVD